jgi:hypothetical protein
MKSVDSIDVRMARLYLLSRRVMHYDDAKLAYAVWFALPKITRVAFRGANDARAVYSLNDGSGGKHAWPLALH